MTDSIWEHNLTLNQLLEWLGIEPLAADIKLSGLATDSRRVSSGELFLALPGFATDGRDYIEAAIKAGAVAVLAEAGRDLSFVNVPVVQVCNLHARAGGLIDFALGQPSRDINVIGVTGTNGKSSSVHFVAELLEQMSSGCGVMGTLGQGRAGHLENMGNTTADILTCHSFAARMRQQNVGWMATEISSHGLDQGRVNGLRIDTAVFTNLTRDHLDYHKTMEAYAAAKGKLFAHPGLRHAIFNADDPAAETLRGFAPESVECLNCSLSDSSADLYLKNIELLPDGMKATVVTPWGTGTLETSLIGRFNLSNLLGVVAVLGCHNFPLNDVLAAIKHLASVPGRLESYGGGTQPVVVIDYAHTSDALKSVLLALREHGGRRISCVFGCGGDRDRGKRPLMAQAACAGADHVYVTSDNPRSEEPRSIIDDALTGVTGDALDKVTVVVDRAEAIALAVSNAAPGDVVLVAGKGHECYQEIKGVRYPFSDLDQVTQALTHLQAGRVA
ncbi:UDP-N-acetylmuramoyl-L-alanyl-D-glutamate--2,6-diaminopimelate ligase [Sansalvadorimonas sp. 2012CJ34-2]|uniref:UDP-N-acetylmuramoyl-L-alanyl-D-glutamate--2,6-diaminopimelate ligase n=1 Tax=Parendozoicomonas callyspongiae TaxID=2942213 RepID=A0ABT0PCC8_9GAMM|nr:UDP-N-acetylmuramoyl-L-alanyl-D-glutamate--2,6-diaminopimelate ligase [Sansalvadorimonas sp. 2012CJ34-2]MCL6268975.1 UDP-N-acetylmuramoyl-L-alanyl-D-glutamate--2,6-diaminopimelate ligase [Sansalvadorimonas sp. 2012CJ34-2]